MTGTYPNTTLHLALDQGGHASRATVFDNRGQVRGSSTQAVETFRSREFRVEHDPVAVVNSLKQACEEALKEAGKNVSIRNAGLATQRSSIVCWDRVTGEPLSNILSWQDRRAADWVSKAAKYNSIIHKQTGLMLSPHYGMSKLRWCLDNLPKVADSFARGRLAFGPMAAFLIHQLLKENPLLVDSANASRTLLVSLKDSDWSTPLLDLFNIPDKPLPRCVTNRFDFGHLSFTNQSIPLTVCTGDQSAALFALGQPEKDVIYVNLGTGGFVQQVCGEDAVVTPRLLSSLVYHDKTHRIYVLEGTVNGAGSAIQKLADDQGVDIEEVNQHLDTWLESYQSPPMFLNGVSGLGSPYWRPGFKSEMIGKANPQQQFVAVIESIVFLVMMNIRELQKHLPAPRKIVISGGLSNTGGLCQRLADLSELRVERPKLVESTARGLAYLLAGPDQWHALGPAVAFAPEENQSLRDRFRLWRQLMRDKTENV